MARNSGKQLKRRTRQHVISDLSVNFVERRALLCGFTIQRWLHDYGIDQALATFSPEGYSEPGLVFMQVKATDHLETILDGEYATWEVERAHLRSWLAEPFPVIFVLYDAQRDRVYWLYVQAAFPGADRFRAAQGSERLTIRIPVSQVLNRSAMRRFRLFRERIQQQRQGVIHRE